MEGEVSPLVPVTMENQMVNRNPIVAIQEILRRVVEMAAEALHNL